MATLAQFATAYVEKFDWFIFPIEPRGKRPLTTHGFKDSSNDPAKVKAWWGANPSANIGLDCGKSNLAVIDLDGVAGIERWNAIADSVGIPLMPCGVQNTGSGEGIHLVYRQPEGARIRNTAGKLGAGIDTRGDGGYIVLAPSVHPCGGVYEWRPGQTPAEGMIPLPNEIASHLIEAPSQPTKPSGEVKPPHFPMRALQRAYERVANAPKGTRNDTLNKAAFYLYHLVYQNEMSEQDVFDTLFNAAIRAGLTERETRATLHSARKGAMI